MNGQRFWGSWNRLPFERRTGITASWLLKKDEQLPDRELCWQTLRRWLLVHLLGQRRYFRGRIPPEARRILWLHLTDHIGDTLMRLSSASLLEGKQVDLLAPTKAVELFADGGLFRRLYCLDRDGAAASRNSYDLVLLDALQTRPLMAKHRLFRTTPFVTQNDFFHYCRDDYNLTLFSWYRMSYLLGRGDDDVEERARVTMEHSNVVPGLLQGLGVKEGAVGIALGGREDYRIYRSWDRVVRRLLQEQPALQLVLLGSENGGDLAQKIIAEHDGAGIVNCVDRLSLQQTAAVIAGCRLLLCVDGGLLHVANAVNTPSVGLFAQEFADLRYTPSDRFRALRSEQDVNSIDHGQIVGETFLALQGQWHNWQVAVRTYE